MFLNYVDFGYWDYGYAEGDIKSIQEATAEINGTGLVNSQAIRIRTVSGNVFSSLQLNAITTAIFSTFSSFLGNSNFDSSAIRNRTVNGNINGTANVVCSVGYLVSVNPNFVANGFVNSKASAIFASKSSFLTLCNMLASGYVVGEEWGPVPDEANTWADLPVESNVWTERQSGTNIWLG